jgi:SAM-dependent methyltransferase
MTDAADTWESGRPYEQYVGRWSRRVAPEFLAWLGLPAGRRWLDVGCGTGALCAAVLDRCSPAIVIGVDPSEGFLAVARRNLGDRVELRQGNAGALPLPDRCVDVVVSGLVLNFIPDLSAAFTEMRRVIAGGGTMAAYVWDYAAGMQLMRYFWDAAVELDRDAAQRDEGIRFPLCTPDGLRGRFTAAGFGDIDVTAIDIPTPFANFEDYWLPFLGGQGWLPPTPWRSTSR